MNETEQVSAVLWYGCLGNINYKVKTVKNVKTTIQKHGDSTSPAN